MRKNNFLFLSLTTTLLVFNSCTPKREFCDCMNLTKAVTDGFTLSENELLAKEEECEWIQKEMSQMQILAKMSSCYNFKETPKNDSVTKSNEIIKPNSGERSLDNQKADTFSNESQFQDITKEPENKISNELNFMYGTVGNFTKSEDVLKNVNFKNRLENLLGSSYNDFQNIYDNSPTLEIKIPYKNQPNEIMLIYLGNGEDNNALIIVNPEKNLINVDLTLNNKTVLFYENSMKSNFFKNKYE